MSVLVLSSDEKNLAKIVEVLRQLSQGRSNAVGSVTLTANASTTTVTAPNCGSGSTVSLFPETANAATEFGAGTLRVGTVSNGSFVITHVNNSQTDRTFRYVSVG